uniref:DNA recombination protein RmuC n=1 Tax=Fulvivirga sp. TaxID=1931237 RepID=UPI00404A04A7
MDNTWILEFLIGIVVGAIIGYLIKWVLSKNNKKIDQLENELRETKTSFQIEQESASRLKAEHLNISQELKAERERIFLLGNQKASLEAEYSNLKVKLAEQKQDVEKLQEKFSTEFKNLANEILEEKTRKFTEQNKVNIGDLLNPLKEKIEKFEEKVEKSSKENIQWNISLKEQIHHLKELNVQITKEAENLTRALKGESKTQGNWGEMQLELILEKAGLTKDIHYFKEKNFKNDEGQNQRPDYIIMLPDDKTLVLDAKVSLTAYSNYYNTEDEQEQARALKMHLESINGHLKLLSEKKYQNIYNINQPDYVMMFVANEPALTLALQSDMSLYEKALDKNIVLVSTTTLLATLKTISYIWKQDLQNKNAMEIARQAGLLYDKFSNFTEDLIKVGKSIDATKSIYQDAAKKLYDGQDNLVRKAERLKELGAKTSKSLDKGLVDRAQNNMIG